MTPFIKVGHRNGHVFLRIVHTFMGRRTSTMVRLDPEDAKKIADELADVAARADGKHKRLKLAEPKPAKKRSQAQQPYPQNRRR